MPIEVFSRIKDGDLSNYSKNGNFTKIRFNEKKIDSEILFSSL